MGVAGRLGDGKMGSSCLMGTEFHFCKMKSVLEMDGADVAQGCQCAEDCY